MTTEREVNNQGKRPAQVRDSFNNIKLVIFLCGGYFLLRLIYLTLTNNL